MSTINKEKIILTILDGFGIGENNKFNNAIFAAKTPFFDKWLNNNHFAKLSASEESVGLPKNQFGNSELGHMTIGSGRTILGINDIFNNIIDSNELNDFLLSKKWINNIINNQEIIHLCGMYSSGCVHSNLKHMNALIKFFENHNKKIALYLISDGRDTSNNIFLNDVKLLLSNIKNTTKIIAISGRYYAMDRDNNWERTQLFYDAMIQKQEAKTNMNILQYIKNEYEQNIDDEFIHPISFNNSEYKIKENDSIIFTNYRADRIRQIIQMFYKNEFNLKIKTNNVFGLCEYSHVDLKNFILNKIELNNLLGEILSKNGISQLRIAETEKFAHVTFFFDGGNVVKYENHDQILIDSPNVPTYNLKPEMSAQLITDNIIKNIDKYDMFIVNYANADMVGHTGDFEATKKAIEILDKQCATLYNNLVGKYNGTLLITADHGNADYMIDENNNIIKTHTVAKVPFIVLSNKYELKYFEGSLQDIAPSILYIYGINIPKEMNGKNLIKNK